jgi:hypothetical protein
MDRDVTELKLLSRRDRSGLRQLLVGAVAAHDRDPSNDLGHLVESAPVRALPAAARLHRVTGAALQGLDGVENVPQDVRARMESARTSSALHHLVVIGGLSQIARAFDDAELTWLVMKGPAVAALLYSDAGERDYADLDLLVGRRDFPTAMAILENLGYRSPILNWSLAERMMAGQIEMRTSAISVDLHWDLYYSDSDRRPFRLVSEELLERRRIIEAFGQRLPTFDAPDTLITLAVHAARSGGHRLLWFKDMERALAVEQPDLDEILRRSRSYRCGPPVGTMLHRARSLLGADVPVEYLRAMVPRGLRAAETITTRAQHPVQFHDRDTATRWLARSMRSSLTRTIGSVPGRIHRSTMKRVRPPVENETDDPHEKASFLAAVAASGPRAT